MNGNWGVACLLSVTVAIGSRILPWSHVNTLLLRLKSARLSDKTIWTCLQVSTIFRFIVNPNGRQKKKKKKKNSERKYNEKKLRKQHRAQAQCQLNYSKMSTNAVKQMSMKTKIKITIFHTRTHAIRRSTEHKHSRICVSAARRRTNGKKIRLNSNIQRQQ